MYLFNVSNTENFNSSSFEVDITKCNGPEKNTAIMKKWNTCTGGGGRTGRRAECDSLGGKYINVVKNHPCFDVCVNGIYKKDGEKCIDLSKVNNKKYF